MSVRFPTALLGLAGAPSTRFVVERPSHALRLGPTLPRSSRPACEAEANPDAKRPKTGTPAIDIIIKKAWEAGWWVERRSSGHVMAYSPDGVGMVCMPSSPSDHRGIRNCRSKMRKYGLKF